MKHWWVNQNQTFTQEVGGGYLWSPKTRRNGARSYLYDAMTYVEPGDLVFSFRAPASREVLPSSTQRGWNPERLLDGSPCCDG